MSFVSIRFVMVMFTILFSLGAGAQTSIVASDGVRYEVQSGQVIVSLKEGESRVIKQASCIFEKESFFYQKKTCTSAKVVTVDKGVVIESGEHGTVAKEDIRLEVIFLLSGMISMLVAVMFKDFFFTFYLIVFAAAIAAIIAATATTTITTTIAIIAAAIAAGTVFINKKMFFLFAIIYELAIISVLYLIA